MTISESPPKLATNSIKLLAATRVELAAISVATPAEPLDVEENTNLMHGWNREASKSLPEAHSSVYVPPSTAAFWKKLLSFAGLGFMISVGYVRLESLVKKSGSACILSSSNTIRKCAISLKLLE